MERPPLSWQVCWGLYVARWLKTNKKLSCRREAAQCFVFVCSQLQHTYSAVFLLPTAALDLLVHGLATQWWKIFEDIFFRFDATHERGRHTDRRTDTAWQHRPRLCIASRGKYVQRKSCEFRFIRGFYVCISIQNILKGNLQPKFKSASVWPKWTAVILG